MSYRHGDVLSGVLAAACLGTVIVGRVNTVHLTEGEALIQGWPYWIVALAFAAAAGIISAWRAER